MPKTVHECIEASCERGLQWQLKDGSMPAGHNGPYKDEETPVRNTSHWLILFLRGYELSGNNNYLSGAEKCYSYLFSRDARPMGATFWHRKNLKKDFSNGLIGQAWSIEALIYSYRVFKDSRAIHIAEQVFLLHEFDKRQKAWKITNVDGSRGGFDPTFNHQLWFAAIGAHLGEFGNELITKQSFAFIKNISKNLKCYQSGVIKHHPDFYLKRDLVSKMRYAKDKYLSKSAARDYIYDKSVGYHGFNLFSLALIAEIYPSLPFFKESLFLKALHVIENERFQNTLNKSKYAYPYNPAGLELAYAAQVFSNNKKSCEYWVGEQFKKTWDPKLGVMNLDNPFDKATAAARLYEGYKLDNIVFNYNG